MALYSLVIRKAEKGIYYALCNRALRFDSQIVEMKKQRKFDNIRFYKSLKSLVL